MPAASIGPVPAARAGSTPVAQSDRGFQVRALGEIAIGCADIEAMRRFYEDVIGLSLLSVRPNGIVFLKIADGYGGHTAVLALFPMARPEGRVADRFGLHHLALTVGYDEQSAAMAHFERCAVTYRIEHFPWIGWRGVFIDDPEGNVVELVAADPAGPSE